MHAYHVWILIDFDIIRVRRFLPSKGGVICTIHTNPPPPSGLRGGGLSLEIVFVDSLIFVLLHSSFQIRLINAGGGGLV